MEEVELNINATIRLRLNEKGRKILSDYFKRWGGGSPKGAFPEDREGYIQMPLWGAMEIFGPHTHIGFDPPFETTIRIRRADICEPVH